MNRVDRKAQELMNLSYLPKRPWNSVFNTFVPHRLSFSAVLPDKRGTMGTYAARIEGAEASRRLLRHPSYQIMMEIRTAAFWSANRLAFTSTSHGGKPGGHFFCSWPSLWSFSQPFTAGKPGFWRQNFYCSKNWTRKRPSAVQSKIHKSANESAFFLQCIKHHSNFIFTDDKRNASTYLFQIQ